MSCSCNCSPCNCLPSPSTCCTPTTETVEYTFENANLAGVGVFDNEADYLVQFRGIVSNSVALTVTLDAGNNTIVLDFDDASLIADIPDATTTQRGILETATNAEALAKAALDKIVTPSNFAAMASTETFAGLVELATNAEVLAGVSTTTAVTPAGFAAAAPWFTNIAWTDSVARLGATPLFSGQIGVQLDTNILWIASGTGAGDFDVPVAALGVANFAPTDTTVDLDGNSFSFLNGGTVDCAGTAFQVSQANSTFYGASTIFGLIAVGGEHIIDFRNATFQIASVLIPANSVLITDSIAGVPASLGLSEFLSSVNTEVWGQPAGTFARTTFTTYSGQTISNPPTQAEVQAIDDALVIVSQRLGGLITDLMASLKPHAV